MLAASERVKKNIGSKLKAAESKFKKSKSDNTTTISRIFDAVNWTKSTTMKAHSILSRIRNAFSLVSEAKEVLFATQDKKNNKKNIKQQIITKNYTMKDTAFEYAANIAEAILVLFVLRYGWRKIFATTVIRTVAPVAILGAAVAIRSRL